MNSSSQEPTQTQEALSVLLCGGLAGVATWVSIFPLGNNLMSMPPINFRLPTIPRRDQDPSSDLRRPLSHHFRFTASSEPVAAIHKTEHPQHCT